MSLPVLSIDLSSSRPRAVLTQVEHGRILVTQTLDLPNSKQPANLDGIEEPRDLKALKMMAQENQVPWYRTALVVPSARSLAITISLPFEDPKSIRRVLENEVQDRVPFDLKEFSLQHQVIGKNSDDEFEILVNMIPRADFEGLLRELEREEIRPRVVTSSVGVAAGLVHMMSEYCSANSILLLLSEQETPAVFRINSKIQLAKILASALSATELINQLRLALLSFEKLHSQNIERIYLVRSEAVPSISSNPLLEPQALGQFLGRPVEIINLSEIIGNAEPDISSAALASYLASDLDIPVLSNFRGSDVGYLPLLLELLRGLRPVAGYLIAAFLALVIGVISLYLIRAKHIGSLETAIVQRINSLLPAEKVSDSVTIESLKNEQSQLESELKELGSLSKLSPLDAFLELSKDLPLSETQVSIYSVSFRENRIALKGSAPSISSIERVEQILKTKKGLYCSVESKNDSSVAPGTAQYGFELVIGLC